MFELREFLVNARGRNLTGTVPLIVSMVTCNSFDPGEQPKAKIITKKTTARTEVNMEGAEAV